MKRETTATFIGHNECYGVSKTELQNEIKKLIEMGVTDFISGGQGGFDRLSARCVYELKTKYPSIQNHLVIPYLSLYYRVVVIRVPLQGLYAILLEILWISISFLPQDGY